VKTSQAAEIVAVLLATFPWVPTSDQTSAAYELGLADLDHAVADAAVQRVIATHAYPNRLPTVAEIREAALTITDGEAKTGLDAWGEVQALLRRGFSSHRAPGERDVDDPLVLEAIRAVGWRAICMADEDDASIRARFIDGFAARAASARRETLTGSLPAIRRLRAAAQAPTLPAPAVELVGDLTKRLTGGAS
jgi:hypothetical protein